MNHRRKATTMSKTTVYFKRMDPRAQLPTQRKGDVGLDLRCLDAFEIPPGSTVVVPTGLALAMGPRSTFGSVFLKIEDRSSMAKKGVFTHGGIIDPTYRGAFTVVLYNSGKETYAAEAGDRIAQAIIYPAAFTLNGFCSLECVESDELEPSERGAGGFGSTGR